VDPNADWPNAPPELFVAPKGDEVAPEDEDVPNADVVAAGVLDDAAVPNADCPNAGVLPNAGVVDFAPNALCPNAEPPVLVAPKADVEPVFVLPLLVLPNAEVPPPPPNAPVDDFCPNPPLEPNADVAGLPNADWPNAPPEVLVAPKALWPNPPPLGAGAAVLPNALPLVPELLPNADCPKPPPAGLAPNALWPNALPPVPVLPNALCLNPPPPVALLVLPKAPAERLTLASVQPSGRSDPGTPLLPNRASWSLSALLIVCDEFRSALSRTPFASPTRRASSRT
jgi:hypothetical protein